MRKNSTILLVFVLTAIFFWLKYKPNHSIEQFMDETRKQTQRDIDVSFEPIRKRNYFIYQIDSLIQINHFQQATQKLDSALLIKNNDNLYIDFKGQIAFLQDSIRKSIYYFTEALKIANGEYPKSLGNRAKAYTRLKIYDSAILDLRKAAGINFDYDRQLGETFQLMKANDSAIKYYNLFLQNYPDSISVLNQVTKLKNSK